MELILYLQSPQQNIEIKSKVFLIGRSNTAQLQIKHPSISKQHAYIELKNKQIFIKDLQSMNGTKINGIRIEKAEQIQLFNNDTIQFGKTNVKYKLIVKNRIPENQQNRSGGALEKKQKKINLKDFFISVDESVAQEQEKIINKPIEKKIQKKINQSQDKMINTNNNTKSQFKNSSIQKNPKSKIGQKKIQVNDINKFLKNIQIDQSDQSQSLKKFEMEQSRLRQSEIKTEMIKQENRRLQIERTNLEAQKLKIQLQVLKQKQQLQKIIQKEKNKIIQQKQNFKKTIEEEYQKRLTAEVEIKKQNLIAQQQQQKFIEEKKADLQKKKKMIELEAETIAKQYQKIYKQTIDRTKNSINKFQQLQKQLKINIKNYKNQQEQIKQQIKQEENKSKQLRDKFLDLNSKNKCLILYASQIQKLIDEVTSQKQQFKQNQDLKRLKMNQNTVDLDEKQILAIRKILKLKNAQIHNLKQIFKQNISKIQNQSPLIVNKVEIVKNNLVNIVEMKNQLYQYIQRQKQSEQKWAQSLKLNNQLSEKIKSTLVQIHKNNQNIEDMHKENTKKLCEYHMQFIKLMNRSNTQKKRAAQFLIQQMIEIEKQKRNKILQNESIHLKIQNLISDSQKLRNQTKTYSQYLFNKVNKRNDFTYLQNLRSNIINLSQQIEKYQDNNSIQSLQKLSKDFERVEFSINNQKQKNKTLNQKINQNLNNYEKTGLKNVIDFFANLVSEKDSQIENLNEEQNIFKNQIWRIQKQMSNLKDKYNKVNQSYQKYRSNQINYAKQLLNQKSKNQ